MITRHWQHLLSTFLVSVAAAQSAAAQVAPAERSYERAYSDSAGFAAASRQAEAGDPAAMLRLGEIYWYGDGVAADRDKGDALFKRAALAGNPGAAAYVKLSADRQQQLGEIRRWTTLIDARQLTGIAFDCEAPTFPPYSSIRIDAREVAKGLEVYRQCYNGYVDKLLGDVPEGRRIPAQVARVMSDDEFEQARLRVHTVVEAELAQLKVRVAPVLAERDRWIDRSRATIQNLDTRWRLELAFQLELDRWHGIGKH